MDNMKKLHIEKFKCFRNVDIPLNQLTVFVGANGYGKSSSIQSILLLKKAIDSNIDFRNDIKYIYLNDVYGQNLGVFESVRNVIDEDVSFSISINSDKINENGMSCEIIEDKVEFLEVLDNSDLSSFQVDVNVEKTENLGGKNFYYLSAERVGPRISQPLVHLDYPNVGIMGEYTAQVIESFPVNEKIDENRCFPGSKNKRLEAQVNEWLNSIFPDVKIKARKSLETLTAQILIDNIFSKGNFATNIGFGISYALPVIVSCLIAEENTFVVIENPEAHLHPAAQATMGKFLAKMSHAGLNIIVETHSDHIIEGIQLYVAKNSEWHDKVTINCFGKKEGEDQPCVESITFNKNAEFSGWPDGFMDQSQIDFTELRNVRTSAELKRN